MIHSIIGHRKDRTMWTQFWDMHSGGGLKESPYHYIYIEASIEEAKVIFYNRFGHNAERISCTCCGDDYTIDEYQTLELASAYHRDCYFDNDAESYVDKPKEAGALGYGRGNYQTLEQYKKHDDVLVIPTSEIKDGERTGDVPEQGYVCVG